MAEVLGVVSSIIGIIQLTGKLTSIGYGYIGGVKRAPKDLGELLDELGSLSRVLISLQHYIDGNKQSSSVTALQKLNVADGPLRGCARELEDLVAKLEPRDGWKGVVDSIKWPLKEKDTAQFISKIERHKSLFVFALTADQISLTREIEKYVQNIHLDIQDIREDLQIEFAAQDVRRKKEEDLRMVEKRTRVLRWLCAENVDKKHIEVSSKMQKGTCRWIFEAVEFREWSVERSGTRLLWGYGIPGAGKTFLSAVVINHFESQSQALNYGVAYVYFDYKEREQQRPIHVISSLVKQLARRIPYLPAAIEDLYDKLEPEDRKPTLEELYIILITIAKLFSRSFIILDALDECDPEKQRKELLPLFHRMGKDGINLFLTSRPHPEDVQDNLGHGAKIKIYAHKEDIRSYIEDRINGNTRAKRLVQQGNCKERIITDLISCAKGMFLLVRFHIEYLCQQTTAKQILTELDKLKSSSARGLDPTYDRAMEYLRGQPKSCEELALRVLSWLVKARRTLTVDEIQVAVSIEENRYELDELDLPDTVTLLDVCAGLVIIDEDTNTVRLAHYTVQEYLLKTGVIPEDADFNLMMACTTYLSFDVFTTEGPCTTQASSIHRLRVHPFLAYAAPQLFFHLTVCPENRSVGILLNFLKHENAVAAYLQYCHVSQGWWPDTPYNWGTYDCWQPPLHVACDLGHRLATLHLLVEGVNLSMTDREGQTALHKAACRGHRAIVELLLEHGADPSFQDHNGRTALYQAALYGHHTVVRQLIEKGAAFSEPDQWGRAPLYIAACQGHEEVTRLLLESGADLDVRDLEGQTLLHKAAYKGHVAVVSLLIEKGAAISSQSDCQWTPLHYAAIHGHKEVIKLLLNKGADHSIQDDGGQTVLHKAAFSGNEEVVRLLLEKGANPAARDYDGETALHSVSFEGDGAIDVIRLLLEKGADPSAQDRNGETPLHKTSFLRWPVATRLLLEGGAPISMKSRNGRTALHLAAHRGCKDVVELLLRRGADPSASDYGGQTALHLAASRGYSEIICLLLDKGVDTSITDSRGETALHIVASQGRKEIVKLLLERGALISLPDKLGETVLDKARTAPTKDIFEMVVGEVEKRSRIRCRLR